VKLGRLSRSGGNGLAELNNPPLRKRTVLGENPAGSLLKKTEEKEMITEEEIVKLKSEILKKNVKLLRFQSIYTILSLEFFKLYTDKDTLSKVKELTKRFELLIKDILEIEQ